MALTCVGSPSLSSRALLSTEHQEAPSGSHNISYPGSLSWHNCPPSPGETARGSLMILLPAGACPGNPNSSPFPSPGTIREQSGGLSVDPSEELRLLLPEPHDPLGTYSGSESQQEIGLSFRDGSGKAALPGTHVPGQDPPPLQGATRRKAGPLSSRDPWAGSGRDAWLRCSPRPGTARRRSRLPSGSAAPDAR